MILRFTVSSAPKFWRALASCVLQGLFVALADQLFDSFHIHGLSSRVRVCCSLARSLICLFKYI